MNNEFTHIWRVEDIHGNGIFRSNVPGRNIRYATYIEDSLGKATARHPLPNLDTKLISSIKDSVDDKILSSYYWFDNFVSDKKFAFNTLAQFRQWFFKKEWRKRMTDVGIFLCKYRVPKDFVWRGETQAVFNPKHAELVARIKPDYRDRDNPCIDVLTAAERVIAECRNMTDDQLIDALENVEDNSLSRAIFGR